MVGQCELESSVMSTPVQPLTLLVVAIASWLQRDQQAAIVLCLLFIHLPAHGSEVSPAARNTLDSARIPRASKLLICGLLLKGRVLAQDAVMVLRRYCQIELVTDRMVQ